MTNIDDLLSELRSAVGDRETSYNSASAAWDIYEGYSFSLVVKAAVAAGGYIMYRDCFGNEAHDLVFRTSPGMLYSKARSYTHAMITFPGCPPLEAHVGVRVQGKSGVLHECDVLVLPVAEADLSRTREVAPRGSRSLIAIECKYYAGHLGLHLARGFHGLHADLGVKNPFFIANQKAPRIQRYLTVLGRNWENGVIPDSHEAEFFMSQLREAFKKYQSSEGWLAV
ncbi:MAG TPA: hypothetical protein VGG75_03705 [Trebonia sp.]|jgi:hypothetical protein